MLAKYYLREEITNYSRHLLEHKFEFCFSS